MNTPIVLLHGWGFTHEVWQPVVEALTEAGVPVDCILTPALPLDDAHNPVQSIQSLAAALPERTHLVGWSLGGEFALALAAAYPDRVASLTLISSTPCFMNCADWSLGQPESLLDDFDHRLAENPVALTKRFGTLIRHGDAEAARDRQLGDALMQCAETSTARLANGLKRLRDLDLRQSTIPDSLPVTVIHGSADAVVLPGAAAWLQQRHHARFVLLEGGSHALPLTHVREIAQTIIDTARSHHD